MVSSPFAALPSSGRVGRFPATGLRPVSAFALPSVALKVLERVLRRDMDFHVLVGCGLLLLGEAFIGCLALLIFVLEFPRGLVDLVGLGLLLNKQAVNVLQSLDCHIAFLSPRLAVGSASRSASSLFHVKHSSPILGRTMVKKFRLSRGLRIRRRCSGTSTSSPLKSPRRPSYKCRSCCAP